MTAWLVTPEWNYHGLLVALGSPRALRNALLGMGYAAPPEDTIQGWRNRNSIPGKWAPLVIQIGIEWGLIKNISDLRKHSLSIDTPIPTARRQALRAFVRHHPKFRDWHMGLATSRSIRNREMLRFAIDAGLTAEVERLLTCPLTQPYSSDLTSGAEVS